MEHCSAGKTWEEARGEIFTPEEIAASDLRVRLIGEILAARKEKGISQRELARMCGTKHSIISRLENGRTSPNLDTVLKILAALGKTLEIRNL